MIRMDNVDLEYVNFKKWWNMEVDLEICGYEIMVEENWIKLNCDLIE